MKRSHGILTFSFFCLLGTMAFADGEPQAPTLIRSRACVARTVGCNWVNWSESTVPNTQNSCTLRYSYLLHRKITVVKPDGTSEVLKDPEEVAEFKTFTKNFIYNTLMDSNSWDRFCMQPCNSELNDVVELYGRCTD